MSEKTCCADCGHLKIIEYHATNMLKARFEYQCAESGDWVRDIHKERECGQHTPVEVPQISEDTVVIVGCLQTIETLLRSIEDLMRHALGRAQEDAEKQEVATAQAMSDEERWAAEGLQ